MTTAMMRCGPGEQLYVMVQRIRCVKAAGPQGLPVFRIAGRRTITPGKPLLRAIVDYWDPCIAQIGIGAGFDWVLGGGRAREVMQLPEARTDIPLTLGPILKGSRCL